MNKGQSVWTKETLWKQIKEDQEDYHYFKTQDNKQLAQTMEAIKLGLEIKQQL